MASLNFGDKFSDFKKYEGATATVTGKIKSHNGKPQIELSSPDQITIKESTPEKTESPTVSPSGT